MEEGEGDWERSGRKRGQMVEGEEEEEKERVGNQDWFYVVHASHRGGDECNLCGLGNLEQQLDGHCCHIICIYGRKKYSRENCACPHIDYSR